MTTQDHELRASEGRPLDLWLERAIEWIAIVTLGGLFAAILLGTVTRYLGLARFEWSFEIASFSFIWLTFLGTVLSELQDSNASFNAIDEAVGKNWQSILRFIKKVALLLVALLLAASSLAMLYRNGLTPSPVLRWPLFVETAVLPVSALIIALIAWRRLLPAKRHGT